ncbi:MAG: NADH-quinone oxidoreductase subunit N [Anaerolineales bacterium]
MVPPFNQILWLLSPELLLLLTALLILALELLPGIERGDWLLRVTFGGLLLALVATVSLWGVEVQVLSLLAADAFSLAVKALGLIATAVVLCISDDYLQHHNFSRGPYYALLIFSALALGLLAAATDLILIFLAFDLLSLTGYALAGYARKDPQGSEAALKYFIYGTVLSAMMLFGLSWIYGVTGTTDLQQVAGILRGASVFGYPLQGRTAEAVLRPVVLPALIMVGAGFAFKVAAAPFHQWAPDVYEGSPDPVTALIAVGPKIAGFAVIIRFTMILLPLHLQVGLDWQVLLTTFAVVTMILGNLMALWQTNVKRLLAHSSVAQVGYILIGIAVGTPRGITAALLHLSAYTVTHLGAFTVVTVLACNLDTHVVDDFEGLHQRSPGLAFAMLIFLLSLVGIPATVGFMGKLWLFSSAMESGQGWLAVLGVVNSVISLGYYWRVIRAMYLRAPTQEEGIAVLPAFRVALTLTLTAVLALGLLPGLLLPLLEEAAAAFFGG